MPDDAAASRQVPKYRNFKRAGMFIGAALLVAAVVMVLRQHQAIDAARDAIVQAPPSQLASHLGVLAISVVINIVLSGALFSLLIKRYGRVGAMEMQALIAAATLLNYVPMRPWHAIHAHLRHRLRHWRLRVPRRRGLRSGTGSQ
jgi:hypothetical protein